MESRSLVLPISADETQYTAVNNVKFSPKIMILYLNDEPVDFAELDGEKYSNTEEAIEAVARDGGYNTYSPGSFNYTSSFQVEDPRQNLKSIDWNYFNLFIVTENMPDQISSVGGRNYKEVSISDASETSQSVYNIVEINPAENDAEEADVEVCEDVIWQSDDADGHLSTAYIRHADEGAVPVKSLWEIGAIHRASKWQTLNLTRA